MNVIDKVAWIHVLDRRVLSTRTRGRTVFYLPGGKREPGESDLETLQREVGEELQVALDPRSIAPFGVFEAQADGHVPGQIVRMTCFLGRPLGCPAPAAEIEEMRWLDSTGAARSSPVDKLVFARLVELDLID